MIVADSAIVTPAADGTLIEVGSLVTDEHGVTIATINMPGEGWWSRILRAGWCDVDWSGFTNGADYDLFMAWFVAGDPRADFDKSGWVNGLDVEAFTEQFVAGGF